MNGEHDQTDPRQRPPDPAGTQPKVDADSLLPAGPGPGAELHAPVAPAAEPEPDRDLPALPAPSGELGAPRGEAPHAPRFQFILGALIALGIAAVALTAFALTGQGQSSTVQGPDWSAWRPASTGTTAITQIATHVGPEYRLPSRQQLVAVNGGPLEVAGLPVTVALRSDPSASGNISLIGAKGALYRLCGLGPRCSIDQGKPSRERHLLLQREALELALYTFRYVAEVNQVVVFMPPKPGAAPSEALYFRPGDLAPELDRPLATSLLSQAPSVTSVVRSADSALVAKVTGPSVYAFSLTQANQDTSVFLVLRPFVVAPH